MLRGGVLALQVWLMAQEITAHHSLHDTHGQTQVAGGADLATPAVIPPPRISISGGSSFNLDVSSPPASLSHALSSTGVLFELNTALSCLWRLIMASVCMLTESKLYAIPSAGQAFKLSAIVLAQRAHS